jgi:hypothetical protein
MATQQFLMNCGDLVLFALNTSRDFGAQISEKLAIPLSAHEERDTVSAVVFSRRATGRLG